MAELGIAASGIGIASLALQVGDCIVRLKSFCNAVKEAPDDIKHLLEEIETLSLVVSGFETSDQAGPNVGHEPTSRCLRFCQRALDILSNMVKEVESEIQKRRRVGSVKAVLKRDAVEKLRERLGTAQSMLMLSNQIYLVDLQKRNQQASHDWAKAHQQELRQLRVVVSQSTETILSSRTSFQESSRQMLAAVETNASSNQSKSLVKTDEPEHNYQRFKNDSRQRYKLKVRFRTPKWLFGFSRAVEIYESRAKAGWNFNIQVYNVIPSNSPVFNMAAEGDVASIQQLFSTGQASPFDRCDYGATVLDHAANNHHLELCKFLKNEGADPNISLASSALTMAARTGYAAKSATEFLNLVQFLAQYVELRDPFEDFKDWRLYNVDADVLAWILQQSNSTYRQRSPEDCVIFAIRLSYGRNQPDLGRLIRTLLQGRPIDAGLCNINDRKHRTLLHCTAWHLGKFFTFLKKVRESALGNLLSLISDLIIGGSQLHAVTRAGRTPMLEVLIAHFTDFESVVMMADTSTATTVVRIWLKQVKDAGVDLVEYGKEEELIFKTAHMNRDFYYWEDSRHRCRFKKLRFIHFVYGPQPEDWVFWLAPVLSNSFMEFWEMIDHPERAMPGAWEEYSDSGEDYSDSDYWSSDSE